MHFITFCVVVILASIASVASAPVEDFTTSETDSSSICGQAGEDCSSATSTSTLEPDPNIDSGSEDLAYAGPGGLPASDEPKSNPNVNDGLDISTGLDPKPCASTSEGCSPESDETISISDLTLFNKESKTKVKIEGECHQDLSGCQLCFFFDDGRKPCNWFVAKCDPSRKNYCALFHLIEPDDTGPGSLIQFEPRDISHIPSRENPNGQTWCTDCAKPPAKKPESGKPFWCFGGLAC